VRFLQEKVGIEATRLQAVGMSEYHPVASNETTAGRSQNRRIEIALLPEVVSIKTSSTN
jgi:chemotaxis protein MotB